MLKDVICTIEWVIFFNFFSYFRIRHWAKIVNLKQFFSFKLNEASGVGDFVFLYFVYHRPMEFVRFFSKDRQATGDWKVQPFKL